MSTHTIELSPDAQPYALSTPRRVSLQLMPQVKAELMRMRSNLQSQVTDRLVCRHGSSAQTHGKSPNLCGPHKIEPKCEEGETHFYHQWNIH